MDSNNLPPPDLNLNRVAVFVGVVKTGSFTAAARALGIPKSSASRSVQQLEEALGARLLQRTTRRLRLTGAGQAYFERVSSALAGLEEARTAVSESQDLPRGVIRIAAPFEWGRWLIAPVIASFVQTYPQVTVDVSLTDREVDLVRDGFDLALRLGRLRDSSLIVRTVGQMAEALFATKSYLDQHGTPATLDDLARHDVIGLREDGAVPRLSLEGPHGPQTVAFTGPLITDDLGMVHEAVRLGMGIGLLPVSGCIAHLGLVRVLPDYARSRVPCSVVYPSARYVPYRVALFRDALIADLQARLANPRTLGPVCPSGETSHAAATHAPATPSESPTRKRKRR